MDAPLRKTRLDRARSALARGRRDLRRVPRWLRVVLHVVVGAFLLYLVAANVVLKTHLLRGWLSKDENKLKVEYTSAWSAYPGHVRVHDLKVRYQDSNIQMLIGLEHATLRFDLLAATKHTVRISKLSAEGTTFLMRHKVESLEGSEGRVAAFPPIEGFPDPPVEKKIPKPPIPDEQYDLWTIELAEVSATVHEVWTMEYRYRGDGRLTGGFHLKPKRELWVAPSVMVTTGGVLSLGDQDLIRGGEGRFEAQIEPFDTREPKGVEVLRHLTARVRQRGELVSPGAISSTYSPKDSRLSFEKGAGPIAIDVDVVRGVVQPTSRVTFTTGDVVTKAPPVSIESDVQVVGHVETSGERPAIVVELNVARAKGTPAADIRGVRAVLDVGNADLTAPFEIARLTASVTSAHFGDLRAWQPIAPKDMTFDGGVADLSARADYRRGALDGRVDVNVDGARFTIGPFSMVSSGKIFTNVESEDVSRAVAFPGGGLDLKDIGLRLQGGHAEGLWLRARLAGAKASTGHAASFDTDIGVESGPGDKTVELFTRMASLPDVAADVTSGTKLDASLRLHVGGGAVTLQVPRAKNGALETRGRLTKKKDTPLTGAFLMSVGPVYAGLELHDGKVSVRPLAGGGWLEEKLQKR